MKMFEELNFGGREAYIPLGKQARDGCRTVSKLMGHSKVETTQIYAKIINKKKDDAIGLIDKAFEDTMK